MRVARLVLLCCAPALVFSLLSNARADEASAADPAMADAQSAIRKAGRRLSRGIRQGRCRRHRRVLDSEGRFRRSDGTLVQGQRAAGEGKARCRRRGPDRAASAHHGDACRFVLSRPMSRFEDGVFQRAGVGADESSTGRYTAVWVKRDGKWLLDGERETPVRSEVSDEPLESLSWMVGQWARDGGRSHRRNHLYLGSEKQLPAPPDYFPAKRGAADHGYAVDWLGC